MNNEFEVLFVTEDRYDNLVAEILFNGQRLCQINKELGNENMEIEFLSDLFILEKSVEMKFSLSKFQRVINMAVKELELCN